MTAFKVILVPTDFDPAAQLALEHAIDLARPLHAKIVLLYACPIQYLAPWSGAMPPDGAVIEAMRDAGRDALLKIIDAHAKCGVELTALSMLGDARSCILDAVTKTGADLIVMGTHGRHGFSRFLLGSTAEAIVRTSLVPVLTVHAPAVET